MRTHELPSLAKFVRATREDQHLSVTALAEKADLTKSEISAIENGRITLPGAEKRRRLAKALGVSHLDLLIAAGEIQSGEVSAAGVVGVVQREPDPAADEIISLVRAIPWRDDPELAGGVKRILDGVRQGIAAASSSRE